MTEFLFGFQLKKLVDKPAAVTSPPALETASNGLEFNGETADDDEEWQVCKS